MSLVSVGQKERLKDAKGKSEAINLRTENAMAMKRDTMTNTNLQNTTQKN
jgi:hypothetical protein